VRFLDTQDSNHELAFSALRDRQESARSGRSAFTHPVVDMFTEPEKRLFKTRVAFANPMSRSNF
jgi:hypothetical protein